MTSVLLAAALGGGGGGRSGGGGGNSSAVLAAALASRGGGGGGGGAAGARAAAPRNFSAFREIFVRALDGLYKTVRRWVLLMYLYLYAIFPTNWIVFLAMVLLFSPLVIALGAAIPPLQFLRDHQTEIFGDLAGAGGTINLAFQDVQLVINQTIRIIRPGIIIWNLTWNGLFYLGLQMWEFFGCTVGQSSNCAMMENVWIWFADLVPWSMNLFLFAWQRIGSIFSALEVGTPEHPVGMLMSGIALNGTLYGAMYGAGGASGTTTTPGFISQNGTAFQPLYYTNGTMIQDLATDLPEHHSYRMVYSRRMPPDLRTRIERAAYQIREGRLDIPLEMDKDRFSTRENLPPQTGPGGCENLVLCGAVTHIVDALTKPDVFLAIVDFVTFLVDNALVIILQLFKDLITIFLPFLEWLLAIASGDLIGFFADLISKVLALFAWVGDVWDSFINVWSSAVDTIMGFFGTLVTDLNGFFATVFANLSSLVGDLINVIGGALTALIQQLLQQVHDAICGACGGFLQPPCPPGFCRKRNTNDPQMAANLRLQRSTNGADAPPGGSYLELVYPQTWPERFVPEYELIALDEVASNRLLAYRQQFCWSVVRTGFDVYEYLHVGMADQLIWVGCVSYYEWVNHRGEVRARTIYYQQIGKPLPLGLSISDLQLDGRMVEIQQVLRQFNASVEQTRRQMKEQARDLQDRTRAELAYSRQSLMNMTTRTDGWRERVGDSGTTSIPYVETLRSLYSGYESKAKRGEPVEQFAQRGIPQERIDRLKKSFATAAALPQWQRAGESLKKWYDQRYRVDYIRVRYPRADIPNTPEWHALRLRDEAREEWRKLGHFIIYDRPSLKQFQSYMQTNGTLLRQFLEVVRGDTGERVDIHATNSRKRGFSSKAFWEFFTEDIWQFLGDRVLDIVTKYTSCNPLPGNGPPITNPNPINVYPTFDTSPQGGGPCLPYIDPDTQLNFVISLDFLFPACCKPPHECHGYGTGLLEARFLARYGTFLYNLDWHSWIGWIPLVGTPIANWLTFPTNQPPIDGWYCFFVSIAGIFEIAFWTTIAFVLFISWIIPIGLCIWCYCNCFCVCCFAGCRVICYPCGICKPRYHRTPQYIKDIALAKEILPFIPGLGAVGAVLRAQAIAQSANVGAAMPLVLPETTGDAIAMDQEQEHIGIDGMWDDVLSGDHAAAQLATMTNGLSESDAPTNETPGAPLNEPLPPRSSQTIHVRQRQARRRVDPSVVVGNPMDSPISIAVATPQQPPVISPVISPVITPSLPPPTSSITPLFSTAPALPQAVHRPISPPPPPPTQYQRPPSPQPPPQLSPPPYAAPTQHSSGAVPTYTQSFSSDLDSLFGPSTPVSSERKTQ